jgi:hypothetical protein
MTTSSGKIKTPAAANRETAAKKTNPTKNVFMPKAS